MGSAQITPPDKREQTVSEAGELMESDFQWIYTSCLLLPPAEWQEAQVNLIVLPLYFSITPATCNHSYLKNTFCSSLYSH